MLYETKTKKENIRRLITQQIRAYTVITISSLLYAIAVSLFLDPNALAPGGVTGISILLNYLTGISTGTWILLLNIPILLLGVWKFGVKFILSTIYCIVLTSITTNLLEPFGAVTLDPLLAGIVGSGLIALALGWVFKVGATTGGMDIIVKVLRVHFPHLKTGSLYMFLDSAVVISSVLVFRNIDLGMYAAITVFLTSFFLDLVLYGRDGAKLVYIVSDLSQMITDRILNELDIGVTYMNGYGAYSGKNKNVILCVIHKQLYPKLENIVKETDPYAFMIVSGASEIYGEGYKNINSEKL